MVGQWLACYITYKQLRIRLGITLVNHSHVLPATTCKRYRQYNVSVNEVTGAVAVTAAELSASATAIPIRFLTQMATTVHRGTSQCEHHTDTEPKNADHLADEDRHVYLAAAIKAGEYAWNNYGVYGNYIGAAIDNPDVTDKESACFAMDGFLALYDATQNTTWLQRARSAAIVAETWHRITDVPTPLDAAAMDWAAGDIATGMSLIAVGHSGSDTFSSMFTQTFGALFTRTGESHFKTFADLTLYNTKQPMDFNGTKRYFKRGFMSELFSFTVGWNVFTSRNDGRGMVYELLSPISTNLSC
eukprot:m.1068059 g.1068059  ORF g.1068059 m.1068059 type:complete len:302 (+) comp24224_c0_seq25:258-1163(+)